MNYELIKQLLCDSFCRDIGFKEFKNGAIVSLPVYDRDGDAFSIYLNEITGGWSLSDGASTIMRLSYENDIDTLLKGSRLELFNSFVEEANAEYDDGELIMRVPADQLITGLFEFTKLMNRVSDLALLRQFRTVSNFKEQLRDALLSILPSHQIHENYIVPGISNAEDYVIDYMIDSDTPLFLFGAANKDAVRLSIITIQYLEKNNINFNSLVVLEDAGKIPMPDFKRLLIAANEVIPDITEKEALGKKIMHRLAV
ncbi:DUF1828 domain-containing protein [Acinetobacter indicus]|uniref:DUF1828 domain-containing protein n=1 Tax=Acinetobacter indicus TaxID=756892 RepID=UPI0025769420|nr:DUF1828 domain-containing protein [Acinetobacter indicus]MDM1771065.1 DUF1828 domain-containing protein [Acinetobacter indicus]MDM1773743.1 DUF1828 domain-containing protein [Acinetobacter indicus]